MQNLNYWKQFESTGRVEDYLSYCACVSQAADREGNVIIAKDAKAAKEQEQSGVNPYAGYSMCNRNGFETDAYR